MTGHDWVIDTARKRKVLRCIHCGLSKWTNARGELHYQRPGQQSWTQIMGSMRLPGCKEGVCPRCGGSGKVRSD